MHASARHFRNKVIITDTTHTRMGLATSAARTRLCRVDAPLTSRFAPGTTCTDLSRAHGNQFCGMHITACKGNLKEDCLDSLGVNFTMHFSEENLPRACLQVDGKARKPQTHTVHQRHSRKSTSYDQTGILHPRLSFATDVPRSGVQKQEDSKLCRLLGH